MNLPRRQSAQADLQAFEVSATTCGVWSEKLPASFSSHLILDCPAASRLVVQRRAASVCTLALLLAAEK